MASTKGTGLSPVALIDLLAVLYVSDFDSKPVFPQVINERLGHCRVKMFAPPFIFGDENECADLFLSLLIPKDDLHDVFVEFGCCVLARDLEFIGIHVVSVHDVDSLIQFRVNYFLDSNSVRVKGLATSSPVLGNFLCIDCVFRDIAGVLQPLLECLSCSFDNLVFHVIPG